MAEVSGRPEVRSPGDGAAVTGGGAAAVATPPVSKLGRVAASPLALLFLLPALLLLGALVVYPIGYTLVRSLFDASGGRFVGLGNYIDMFTSSATRTAMKNNLIWVVVAPTVVTAVGLVFAVLTERIRWAAAFKFVVFMPMAISFLAAGVIFRLVYEQDPDRGVANAVITSVHDAFGSAAAYPGARPRGNDVLAAQGKGYVSTRSYGPGDVAELGLVGVPPQSLPATAANAVAPTAASGGLAGIVWLDFSPGGAGAPGRIDAAEKGLSGVSVQALQGSKVIASAKTGNDGRFQVSGIDGPVRLRLAESNFKEPFGGVTWLGSALITPAIIASYVWIWAGFAMVLIAAGLAAIPRDALEAARVDGATEWQVFRRVTVPLLAPVLVVVFVTLVINVLKVFDLVLIIAPGSVQDDANVLALQMWRVSFGGGRDQGLGSALGIFLFLLVLPAMLFNIRRFRQEQR